MSRIDKRVLVIAFTTLVASTAIAQTYVIGPPRGGSIARCEKACKWDGGADRTVCVLAVVTNDGCKSPPWRHDLGEGNTIASLSVCYRPVVPGVVWCDYVHGVRDVGVDVAVELVRELPEPLPALIFKDGFESGDTRAWSSP